MISRFILSVTHRHRHVCTYSHSLTLSYIKFVSLPSLQKDSPYPQRRNVYSTQHASGSWTPASCKTMERSDTSSLQTLLIQAEDSQWVCCTLTHSLIHLLKCSAYSQFYNNILYVNPIGHRTNRANKYIFQICYSSKYTGDTSFSMTWSGITDVTRRIIHVS